MAKELNEYQVRLTFDANTEKAKKQLKDLQQQLQSLATGSGSDKLNFSDEIAKASKAAAELSAHLSQATNLKTGTLDFTKLNDSIKKSGQSLANYGEQLLKLGPSGQQAFQKLATAVSNSEIPVRRISNTLREMGTVLKNTIKWQISSSAIHSFMGAVQSAYGYAQDLNESLNNIRIVTGQNIEQMERFAASANKAAKALSASTLDYTDAALIYYQQGLSDEEVKARTDVTVKMANVTGDSAEKVSQQLTAVWNNFAKGADNLEYFADVMTALGAATASSSDEISSGLEKFASVGETVGLSYEYAASALATITATTRQSAEVVGNALKTIFARLEGLKLGETLEDETDLNKYSQALHNVGVEIKDTSGNLRSMDDILDDTAVKWQTLSKDQQMALAQTVAGVRQYTQFVALMNNWDFMQDNVEIAKNSTGTLQEQADVYAESWEAAQKRVKAAAESVYQSLIDDKFFITLLDGTEKVITGVNNLIKAVGGLPGVLSVVATVFTNLFEKQMVQGLENLTYNLKNLTEAGQRRNREEKQQTLDDMSARIRYSVSDGSISGEAKADNIIQQLELQQRLIAKSEELTDVEKATANILLEQLGNRQKNYEIAIQQEEEAINQYDALKDQIFDQANFNFGWDESDLTEINEQLKTSFSTIENGIGKVDALNGLYKNMRAEKMNETEIQRALIQLNKQYNLGLSEEQLHIDKVKETLKATTRTQNEAINKAKERIDLWAEEEGVSEELVASLRRKFQAEQDSKKAQDDLTLSLKEYNELLDQNQVRLQSWQQNVVQGAQLLSSLSMTINQIKGIVSVLNNEDMSFFEKLLSISMSLGMAVPNIMKAFNTGKGLYDELVKSISKYVLAKQTAILVEKEEAVVKYANNLAQLAAASTDQQTIKNMAVKLFTKKGLIKEEEKEIFLKELDNLTSQNGNKISGETIAAALKNTVAKRAENTTLAQGLVLKAKDLALDVARHWYILAIAAAIAALVAVIYLAVKAYNADADAAKRAAEAAENLRKNSEEVAQKAQDIKQAFDGYNSAIKTLEECTKGTQAWKDALKEVNNQVLDILAKYPELSGQIQTYRDTDGTLRISNADQIIAQAEQNSVAARNAAIQGNIYAQQTQLASDVTNTQRRWNDGNRSWHQTGSIIDRTRSEIIQDYEKYANMSEKAFSDLVGTLGLSEKEFYDFYLDLRKLDQSAQKLNTTIQTSSELMIDNYMGEDASPEAKAIASNALGETTAKLIDKIIAEGDILGFNASTGMYGEVANKAREDLEKLWREAGGIGELNFSKGFLGFGDSTVTYLNENGKQTVSVEEFANKIAAKVAIQNASDNAAQAAARIAGLNKYNLNNASIFGGYITSGNFESSSQTDLTSFQQLVSNQDEFLQALGLDSIEEFKDTFHISLNDLQNNLKDALTAFDEIGKNLTPVADEMFTVIKDKLGETFDSLPLDKQKEYVALANQLANTIGRDGIAALGSFDKATIDLIKEYDWASGSVYDFNSILEDAGLATLDTNEALKELVEKMLEAAKAAYTLADAQKAYADVHKITDKLKNGGEVTKEEYQTLISNIPELANWFMNTVSDSYAFTGEKTQLDDFINTILLKNFDKSAESYTQNRDLLTQTLSDNSSLLAGGIDIRNIQDRIDFLTAAGQDTSKYQAAFNNESIWQQPAMLKELYELTEQYANNEEFLTSKIAEYNDVIKESIGIQGTAVQNTTDLSNRIKNGASSIDEQEKALIKLGTQYDVTIPLVQKYKQAIKDFGNESTQAKQAAADLWKELRKQEWATLLGDLEKSLKVLATEESSRDDVIKANQEIANSFNEMFETAIDASWVDEHKQLFIDLANADAEQVNDIAENIRNLMNLDDWVADQTNNIRTLLGDVFISYDELVSFIANNPIQIDAEGEADVSGLIAGLSAAGATAEQVAAILKAIGQTNLTIMGENGELLNYDLSDIDQFQDFWNKLQELSINFGTRGVAPEIPNVFGTGARDYTKKINEDKTGKGSGGNKSSVKKENKETKEDRYHVEEDRLDNLSKAYDRLEKAKSHAYGPDKLKHIQQEIDLLDDEIAAQEALAAETEKYLEQDVSQLNYGKKNAFYIDGVAYDQRGLDFYGLTAQIDQFGAISNYNEIMAAGLEKYNAAVDEYNTAGSAHYQDENFLKYEKEQWKGLQDLVSQTEETIDKNYEEITEYQEKIRKQNALRLEKITTHLEFHIELNARDLKEVEYQLSKLGDDVYKTGEVAALLWSQNGDSKASLAVDNINRYKDTYEELNKLMAANQLNEDEYYDAIKKVSDGLYEELGNLQDLNETAKTYYSDTLQKMGEKISWFTDRLAHNNSVLEHMKNIYLSLTQEDNFAEIGKFIDASLDHAEKELEVAKATTDAYREQKEARQLDFNEAKRLYEEALASGNENAIEAARNGLKIAENELKAITEAFEEAEEKELETFNSVISLMIEKIKNNIQKGYQEIGKTFTNGLGWDAINQQMSLAEKLGDKYLTKTNQVYEMSKLISQVNRDIEKTNNFNSKTRLKNFTTELENLKNTNQLSKNSLAIEQAKYEVLKAQLALEEAKDAKSVVRLQRDNEGNFGYVFTADRDDIADAEANLAQKQNDLYNLSLQQANDSAKELIQITQEKYAALEELDLKYATDRTNPVYLEQRVALEKYYDDLILANTKDHLIASQILQDNSITKENDSWSNEWKDLTQKHYGYIEQSDTFWTTNFANTTGKTQEFFNSTNPLWTAYYSGIMSGAQETQEKVTAEMQAMSDNNLPVLQNLADTIGKKDLEGSLVNRYGSLEEALGKIEAADKLVLATLLDGEKGEKGLISSLKDEATEAHNAAEKWQEWYKALYGDGENKGAITAAQEINGEIQTMLEKLALLEDTEYTITEHHKTVYDPPVGNPTGTSYATPPASTTGTDSGAAGTRTGLSGTEISKKNNYRVKMQISENGSWMWQGTEAIKTTEQAAINKFQMNYGDLRENPYRKNISAPHVQLINIDTGEIIDEFRTGGYTGSWGPEGKLATLHEKELVLNADDTRNFLAGVSILRDITQAIDLQAVAAAAAPAIAMPGVSIPSSSLDQHVTIAAEFPNVTNHLEIEEAFNNLVNRASQYANRF